MNRSVYLMRIKTMLKIYLNIALFSLTLKHFYCRTLKTKDEHGDMREEVDDLRFLAKVPFSCHAHQRSLRSLEHENQGWANTNAGSRRREGWSFHYCNVEVQQAKVVIVNTLEKFRKRKYQNKNCEDSLDMHEKKE